MSASERVTALREHPRRAGRYVVELDGQAVGAVSVDRLAELGLRVGGTVDAALRSRLERAAREVACYDRATDALARRARSRSELTRWLRTREFTASEIDPALDKLAALGLLDDRAYARGFARSRLSVGRGYGPRRVAAELARRGVSREIVDEVLAELRDEGPADEQTAIEAVAARKWRTLAALEPQVARRRLIGFLSRRGFSTGAIAAVVRQISRSTE